MKYPVLDQSIIQQVDFPENQYHKEVFTKKQIVLHHTASGPGVDGDIRWWMHTPERVGTSKVIGREGTIYSCFDSKYWASHLGLNHPNNGTLQRGSIGIEIDAWGVLAFIEGEFRAYTGAVVLGAEVAHYPEGFKTIPSSPYYDKHKVSGQKANFFHKYTMAQIMSVAQLLELWSGVYGIPLTYHADMWAVSDLALAGEPGVWTHVSFLGEKSDCHPQPELIEMLQNIG